jgi:hypothetical protein
VAFVMTAAAKVSTVVAIIVVCRHAVAMQMHFTDTMNPQKGRLTTTVLEGASSDRAAVVQYCHLCPLLMPLTMMFIFLPVLPLMVTTTLTLTLTLTVVRLLNKMHIKDQDDHQAEATFSILVITLRRCPG